MKKVFLILLLSASLYGCVTEQAALKQNSGHAVVPLDYEKWKKYGAVFEYDNLSVIAEFDPISGFGTTFKVSQKMTVLSREGVQYATYNGQQYPGDLTVFKLKIVGGEGVQKQVNVSKVKQQFIDTGEIVVPQVESGSEIFVEYTYLNRQPFDGLEYILNRDIPVLNSTTTFSHSFSYKFRYKTYGIAGKIKKRTRSGKGGFQLQENTILPVLKSRMEQQQYLLSEYRYQDVSRVAIGFEAFKFQGKKYGNSTWKELASSFSERYMDPSLFSTEESVQDVISELHLSRGSDHRKADEILKYVQDNISIIPVNSIESFSLDVDRVLDQKQGNIFEVTAVLGILFKEAGLKTHNYLTRSRLNGGFDPDFPSWQMMEIPLVSVEIEGKEKIAFPFIKDCLIGEYFPEINNNHALNLQTGETNLLPRSVHDGITFTSTANLSLSKIKEPQSWDFVFGDQAAIVMRVVLSGASETDLNDFSTELLAKYSDQYEVVSASYAGNTRGENAGLWVQFKNPNLIIHHPQGEYIALTPFFRKYFEDFPETDSNSFSNEFDVNLKELVRLRGYSKEKNDIAFSCETVKNAMFESTCSAAVEGDDYVIKRELSLKRTTVEPGQFVQIRKDIELLNNMGASYALIKR